MVILRKKVLIIFCILASLFCLLGCSNDANITFNGKVVSKYEDPPCLGYIVVALNGQLDTEGIYSCGDSLTSIYQSVHSGDSIIKIYGSDSVMVFINKERHSFIYPIFMR